MTLTTPASWCPLCGFYHPLGECDTRCMTGLGSLGLVPCHKPGEYMLMMAQPRSDEGGYVIVEAATEDTRWQRHWCCAEHIAAFAKVFIPGPTEIRILPVARDEVQ